MTADLSIILETNFKQESDKAIQALDRLEGKTKSSANSTGKAFKVSSAAGATAINKLKEMSEIGRAHV